MKRRKGNEREIADRKKGHRLKSHLAGPGTKEAEIKLGRPDRDNSARNSRDVMKEIGNDRKPTPREQEGR